MGKKQRNLTGAILEALIVELGPMKVLQSLIDVGHSHGCDEDADDLYFDKLKEAVLAAKYVETDKMPKKLKKLLAQQSKPTPVAEICTVQVVDTSDVEPPEPTEQQIPHFDFGQIVDMSTFVEAVQSLRGEREDWTISRNEFCAIVREETGLRFVKAHASEPPMFFNNVPFTELQLRYVLQECVRRDLTLRGLRASVGQLTDILIPYKGDCKSLLNTHISQYRAGYL